ncbi:MAG: spore germination protein [Bacillota bacterium]|nr:spore germination protein [Bacillota bacterium]
MENKLINEALIVNENFLKNKIGESFDTKYRSLKIPAFNNAEAFIVYISGMIDARVIDETILEPLMKYSKLPQGKLQVKGAEPISILTEQGVFTTALKETRQWEEICDAVMEGDTILFIDQCPSALILTTRKYEGRTVNEPSIESEIRGPRDGFIENIQTNAALIRRRIKDYSLRFDNMKIGERTKTVVSVTYIESLVDEALLKEVKSRLEKINVDGIIASEYIQELIEDSPFSLFPKMTNTERPDKACAALLDGRVLILVDNTPFVIIVPTVFWQFLISSGDYYEKFYLATFLRWVRIIAMFLSISASSLYVLLTSFHQEMLPTALALKIAEGRQGVPFPAVLEAAVMEIILEIMKEAGLRLPKPIGQTISIVGTLVIGQTAVAAGLVSSFLLIVIAVAAISSYAIPSYTMSNALRLVRFPILILTAFFGLLGYLAGIITLLMHLMSLRSFGTPYLSPVIPFDKNGNKDVFIRTPWWKMLNRPKFVRSKDRARQTSNLKPKPPSEK